MEFKASGYELLTEATLLGRYRSLKVKASFGFVVYPKVWQHIYPWIFTETFSGAAKYIAMQISIVMLFFIVLGQNFRGAFQEKQKARGAHFLPPLEKPSILTA